MDNMIFMKLLFWKTLDGPRAECMNEGEPFFEWPSYDEVFELWKEYIEKKMGINGNHSEEN